MMEREESQTEVGPLLRLVNGWLQVRDEKPVGVENR